MLTRNAYPREDGRMAATPSILAPGELVIPGALIREIDDAMVLPCDFQDCLGQHRHRATWLIEVKHGPHCEVEPLAICSLCRNGLYRSRHEPVDCAACGPLGYPVQSWWRPLRALP